MWRWGCPPVTALLDSPSLFGVEHHMKRFALALLFAAFVVGVPLAIITVSAYKRDMATRHILSDLDRGALLIDTERGLDHKAAFDLWQMLPYTSVDRVSVVHGLKSVHVDFQSAVTQKEKIKTEKK